MDINDKVQMCVCKGTVVPLKYVQIRNKRRRRSPLPDAGSETPTLCEVIVPSALVGIADYIKEEPISPVSLPSPPPSPSPTETRKQRNRESAAKSRIQKRKYIASLEQKVEALSHTVRMLTEENQFWRGLGLVRGDATCPLAACEAFLPD